MADPPRSSRRARAALLLGPPAYAAATAVYLGQASGRTWLGIGAALAFALHAARPRVMPVVTSTALEAAQGAARARTAAEVALVVALSTAALRVDRAWIGLAGDAAVLVAGVALVAALRRAASAGGLALLAVKGLRPSVETIERVGLAAVALGAGSAIAAQAGRVVGARWAGAGASAWSAGAGAFVLFAAGATALLLSRARRLELGAAPRLVGAAIACGLGLLAALVFSSALGPAHAARVAAALGAYGGVRFALAADAVRTETLGRRALALAAFAGPIVLLASLAIDEAGAGAAGTVAVASALTALVGLAVERLEEPFLPAGGAHLRAFSKARVEAFERDVGDALAHALVTLRAAAGHEGPSAELWTVAPAEVLTVDAAGYLRERAGEVPPMLLDVAAEEPEATLRTEVLEALDVRRPDLRPLLRWLEGRDALCAVLVAHGREAAGVLVVPRGARREGMTLEEVRALKRLGDTLIAACEGRSARARSLMREVALRRELEALEHDLARDRHAASLHTGRARLESERLAKPATIGMYSAPARLAFEALERRAQTGAPIAIVAPSGVDPVPYVARAHLGSPRAEGPLVVVDCTSSREHDVSRWLDPKTSPLALADRGVLLLVDVAALPREVELVIARALAERRPPWERAEPIAISLAVSSTRAPADLEASGLLTPELAQRLGGADPIALPRLRDRAEDLRAIVADRVAREGLRVHGAPMGLEAAAFAVLADLPFDGEDAELTALVQKLVARAGPVESVTRAVALAVLSGEAPAPPADELSDRRQKSRPGC